MRLIYMITALAVLLFGNPALAVEKAVDGMKQGPVKTRQEAITRTKERLAKLEAMSDEEWNKKRAEMKKNREERRAKRQARVKEKRDMKREEAPAAGAPATATPPVPEVIEKR